MRIPGFAFEIRETVGRLLRLSPRSAQAVLVDLVDPLGDALGLVRHRATQQGTRLAREDEGWQALKTIAHGRERVRVGPVGLLCRGMPAP